MLAFDVSVPSSPVLTRAYTTPSRGGGQGNGIPVVRDVVHSRDIIYAGGDAGGLVVLQTKDTEAPNIQITDPTALPVYTNATGSLNLAGTASDNVGLTRVTWSNDRGGGGDATGTISWSVSVISGPASLSNNVLVLLGAGAVTMQASQPGDDLFNPALTTNVSFTVAKADQAIAFPVMPDKLAGDPPPSFALSATASSGLPVYFDIVSGPAVLDTNVVTLLGGGAVTVSAWQPGNSNYHAAATVQRSFNVARLTGLRFRERRTARNRPDWR